MQRIKQELLKFHPNASTLDGVKFNLKDGGSVLVRASETRHTVKVFAEADNKERADALLKEYSNLVKKFK